MRSGWLMLSLLCAAAAAPAWAATPPTDNPVATYYSGDEGYPAWTGRVRWDNVIDMSAYAKGETSFEKFENARDELAAKGGGVLYYQGGEYDFSDGPLDGPKGRGLMLKPGVVLRGEAPQGRPRATSGRLELPTKLVFGFTRRDNAIETGERASVWLDGGLFSMHRDQRRPVRLQLRFPAWDGHTLYVAFRVLDDDVRTDSREPWNSDSVEVFLDYRNDRETVYNADDRRIVVDASGRIQVVGLARHIQKAAKRFEGGYAVEVALSGWNMGGYDGFKGKVIGFDVACNDSDTAGRRDGRVVWRGTQDNETDPSGFGTALFPEK